MDDGRWGFLTLVPSHPFQAAMKNPPWHLNVRLVADVRTMHVVGSFPMIGLMMPPQVHVVTDVLPKF